MADGKSVCRAQNAIPVVVKLKDPHLFPYKKQYPLKREVGSVQFSSVAQSCPTLCDPMDCSMPGLSVRHQLPEFTQIHVH